MISFKKWLESTDVGFTTTPNLYGTGEVETDSYLPDPMHIAKALSISAQTGGFFQAFRSSIKKESILAAFRDALKMSKGQSPFNYSKDNWLNDKIQRYIAQRVGMPFQNVEIYCEPLKRDFVNIFNQHKSWDGNQLSKSWPTDKLCKKN